MKKHVILLGDSIFDNAKYVPGEDSVIDQLRTEMPSNWKATLLATDGDVTADVLLQLERLPYDATDVVISVGGNDALQHAGLLAQAGSADDLSDLLAEVMPRFRMDYSAVLDEALRYEAKVAVCTIFDQCPFPEPQWRELVPIALNSFNECIMVEAENRNIPVIDLREICTEPEDYSPLSPIEPSSLGGMKIVAAVIRRLSK